MASSLLKVWAMRTSRESPTHREFIRSELAKNRLRQGWGYNPSQDLRLIKQRLDDQATGWKNLSEDEKLAWSHWRMLGDLSGSPDAMSNGDIVLIPNLPDDGFFTLCKLTSDYEYDPDISLSDFGHYRGVKVLTPEGVNNQHPHVSSGLKRSLKCLSRLWSIAGHSDSVQAILTEIDVGGANNLRVGSDHVVRAMRKIEPFLQDNLNLLASSIRTPLFNTLQASEWEPVFRKAMLPLLQNIQIIEIGGPTEKGADLEIHIPNPFMPTEPWIIAVQIKDYRGEISVDVAGQLETAIKTRMNAEIGGRLLAVILASTDAKPSNKLDEAMKELSKKYNIMVSCYSGDDIMKMLAKGLSAQAA